MKWMEQARQGHGKGMESRECKKRKGREIRETKKKGEKGEGLRDGKE